MMEIFDDFGFARLHGNSSEPEFNDGVYVELLYEGNNTLYAEKGGDGNGIFLCLMTFRRKLLHLTCIMEVLVEIYYNQAGCTHMEV